MGINGEITLKLNTPLITIILEEMRQIDPETDYYLDEGPDNQKDSLAVSSETGWMHFHNLDRWWNENYQRGNWPRIRRLIEVALRFSEEVYYNPDNRCTILLEDRVAPQRLIELDKLWENFKDSENQRNSR